MKTNSRQNCAPHSPQNFIVLFAGGLTQPHFVQITSAGSALPQPPQNLIVFDVPQVHFHDSAASFADCFCSFLC
jgi:hypothetical protein